MPGRWSSSGSSCSSACCFAFGSNRNEGIIKPGLTVVIFVIAFVNWTYIARIIRGQVLSLREKEFIEAARAQGASNTRILFKEILPNLVAPIIVYSTLIIPTEHPVRGGAVVPRRGRPAAPGELGRDDRRRHSIFDTAWWYMLFPGIALLLTVLAFNLLGRRAAGRAEPEGRQVSDSPWRCRGEGAPRRALL